MCEKTKIREKMEKSRVLRALGFFRFFLIFFHTFVWIKINTILQYFLKPNFCSVFQKEYPGYFYFTIYQGILSLQKPNSPLWIYKIQFRNCISSQYKTKKQINRMTNQIWLIYYSGFRFHTFAPVCCTMSVVYSSSKIVLFMGIH